MRTTRRGWTLALVWTLAALSLSCAPGVAPLSQPEGSYDLYPATWGGAGRESCSWFGDRSRDLLYFGVSGYWAEAKRGGAATALSRPESPRIGRFHLGREEMLAPLEVRSGPGRGGVWDVLALRDTRLVYTGLGEDAGWLEPNSGESGRLGVGAGANEIVAIAENTVAISNYFSGEVVIATAPGPPGRRIALETSPGLRVAPKSVAFDPSRGARGWLWVTTDLFPDEAGLPRHDARAIDLETGAERLRITTPELQNLIFDTDGTGYLVWSTRRGLSLQILAPEEPAALESGRHILLHPGFDAGVDFAQDIALEPNRHAVITLWSGLVLAVSPRGVVRSLQLPRGDAPGSLYYTAALVGDRICATRCAGVAVVCGDLP